MLTFRMRSVAPSRNIIQSQQGYENCLLKNSLHHSCELLLSMAYRTLDFQHSIRKAEQGGDDLRSPLMSAVYANGLRTANLFFMAYGTQDFQHSIRTAARKRRQLTTVRANCLRTANLLFMAYGTTLYAVRCTVRSTKYEVRWPTTNMTKAIYCFIRNFTVCRRISGFNRC